ncbi:DUF6082 family protein [Streptomyces sp. NPDC056399]|uniref:DUF6082 family protein n=1 Tax=Streptomyces sp. NPDC056399 TaxID=3345807 RepID=UPI0035E3BAA8
MRTSTAILISAGVSAIGIAFSHVQHRQRLELGTAELHQNMLADTLRDPDLLELWRTRDETLEKFKRSVGANRQLSFTALKYRLGLLSPETLRVQTDSLMHRRGVREHWEQHQSFRMAEAGSRRDREFLTALAASHQATQELAPPPVG